MSLYYYDGNKFQRCLNTDTVSGLPLDKRVEDLAFFLESGGNVNTLLSELRASETCFYEVDKVPKLLHVLTSRGWELILTEDMNIRPKGLHTKECSIVKVSNPISPNIECVYNLTEVDTTGKLTCTSDCIVKVKMVPKAIVSETFELTELELCDDKLNSNELLDCFFPNNINQVVSEVFTNSHIEFQSTTNIDNVIINIAPE